MSKGDRQRPMAITRDEWDRNYNRVFRSKKKKKKKQSKTKNVKDA